MRKGIENDEEDTDDWDRRHHCLYPDGVRPGAGSYACGYPVLYSGGTAGLRGRFDSGL